MKEDLKNREDVYSLVTNFYTRVRADVLLGPIFNRHIKNWPSHFEHLTDFWEGNLFMKRIFIGHPLREHKKVDRAEGYIINEQHFNLWLKHWEQTVDVLFEGEKAETAKFKARKIGGFFLVHLLDMKP
ncbi:group III truncated hemoglobin [Dokdonia sp. Hel_I_53]|uniref:group III truncated hemoglobin n=1 Tax=Dokdonia sp. Hel_I_53 TaxID=1566287 RepID=UPI00119C5AAE|nr:group III truncated hemoglobin [Dokdonia sp. Hel_I_53]TVZ52991.1 hemoglobin [Dokdonia sp. Hel_I_53]